MTSSTLCADAFTVRTRPPLTVVPVSSLMENRAAVFTNQPQVVEVYRAGSWCAGELLGWRHDERGGCQVWVRVVADGVEQTSWTQLGDLRLPERATGASAEPAPHPRQERSSRRAAALLRSEPVGAETTASLPLARDHVAGEMPPRRPGGRRRAPEDVDVQVARASAVPVPAPGRHRARSVDPAAGRHRDADTGLLPAVTAEPAGRSRQDVPAAHVRTVPAARRVAEPVAGRPTWAAQDEELLTRPMRLTDADPHSRRPRLVAL